MNARKARSHALEEARARLEADPMYWRERFRLLTEGQLLCVLSTLERQERRLMNFAAAARRRGCAPDTVGAHQRDLAFRHSANVGALRIARGLLKAIGVAP